MILDVTQSHQRIKRLHQRAATRQNPQLQRKAASESPTYKSSAVRGADAGGLGVNAAAVKLRPIPDECRRQTHRISEKKRAINAPLANESDWRSSQSRAGDVELVSVIIILALGVPAHTETQTETTASCKHERRMNGCTYTSLCWGSSFLSLVCLLTPVVKYVYVRFWILVRKLVMLISHCVLQRHQGDSSRKGGMFLCKWRLNGAATRKRLGELRRYAASVGGSEVDFCICV